MAATKSNSSVLAQASHQRFVIAKQGEAAEKQFKKHFKNGNVVGRGVWGVVSNVCPRNNTKNNTKPCYALKRIRIRDTTDFQTADMDYQYLFFLTRVRLNGFRIVPKAERMWLSVRRGTSYYNLLMSKYDGNMHYLCVNARRHLQVPKLDIVIRKYERHNGIYYRSELLRMYAIAWLIGQHGVIHGDLKPDQYLFNYRKRKTDPVKDIALTDFGFAGLVTQVRRKQNAKIQTRTTKQSHIFPISRKKFGLAEMGWPSNEKSPNSFGVCKSGLIELTTPNEASLMNIAHLEAFLISDGSRIPTFVIDDRLPEKDRELLLFTGVDRFLSAVKANHKIRLWFPGTFFSEYANCVRVWKKESENLCFNFHDIVKAAR